MMGKKFAGVFGLMVLLAWMLTLASSQAQQIVTDQQVTLNDLFHNANEQVRFALEAVALASTAPTARAVISNACSVLSTIEGRASTPLHPSCPTNNAADATGIKSYVALIKSKIEQAALADVSLTFRNIQTYLNKASDLTKDVLTKLTASESRFEETKIDMLVVLAFLSAIKGRSDDAPSYGGLLTIEAHVGK
ncbi:hypothetical protein HYR54_09615 [Candidatus Acetothermia bacterium]|nr:hypothetical protein [Candidatus Acetothermia bacterium]